MYSLDPEDQYFTDVTVTGTPPLYDNGDAKSQDSGLWYASVTEVDVKVPTIDKPVSRSARESRRTSTRDPKWRPVTVVGPATLFGSAMSLMANMAQRTPEANHAGPPTREDSPPPSDGEPPLVINIELE